jgi:hypothetical protein
MNIVKIISGIALAAAMFLAPISGSFAATGDKLDRTKITQVWSEEFTAQIPIRDPRIAASKGYETYYYFGSPLNYSSREIPGELESYGQPWLGQTLPVKVMSGFLLLNTYKTMPSEFALMGTTKTWVSGLWTTRYAHDQQYGYFETKAKLPGASQMWPAFWMLPTARTTTNNKGNRPEIDIFEFWNGQLNLISQGTIPITLDRWGIAYNTTHWQVAGAEKSQQTNKKVPDYAKTFHTYGVLWTPTTLVYYIDDIEVGRVTDPAAIPHEPYYMLLNTAVSADWKGTVPATSVTTTQMMVDYVRAYTLK